MLHGTRVASEGAGFSFDVFKGGEAGADLITVPDAHLLFSGDFQRSGSFDLKITGDDGKSFVVLDYFRPEKRATLKSADGALMTPDVVEALAGPLAPGQYAQAAPQPAATEVIGRVATVTGSATVLRNGVVVTLNAGDAIQKGDVVQTGSGSTLGITFIDGSTFNLTAGARMVINELVYEAGGSNNAALISLVQGAANFVAGQIAKTGDMKVATPVATMGIRGTAVILDISSVDGRVSVSVIDQGDKLTHTVEMFAPNGTLLGRALSIGGTWVLTANATFGVLAQEIGKTPQQVALEFAAFQALLNTYEAAKPFFPTPLPEHTDVVPKSTDGQGTQTPYNDPALPKIGSGTPPKILFTELTLGGDNNNDDDDDDGDGLPDVDGPPPVLTEIILSINQILGTDGNDLLEGTDGNDHIFGFGGDDTIIAGHGGGNDIYDGGEGDDIIKYESTALGVTIELFGKNGGHLTATAHSATETGDDIIVDIEQFVGGSGNDVFNLHDNTHWEIDGGEGIDTIRLAGDLDIREHEGPETFNFEIVDLNTTGSNLVDIDAEGVADMNDAHTIRVLGGPDDQINVMSDFFGHPNGHWVYVGPRSDLVAFGADDHFSDGVTFDLYQFVDGLEGEDVLATAYVQQGIGVDVIEKVTVTVHTPDGFDLSAESLYPAMADSEASGGSSTEFFAYNEEFEIAFRVIGTGLTYEEGDDHFVITGGRITAIEIYNSSEDIIVSAVGFDFSAADFWVALQAFGEGDASGLDAIFENVEYHGVGGAGNDVFEGGNFSDRANGMAGDDTITGGDGGDIFVYGQQGGADTVTDFWIGDRIDVTDFSNLQQLSDILSISHEDGIGNTIITFSEGNTLTLVNVDRELLIDDHFIFAQQNGNHPPVVGATPPSATLVEDGTDTSNVNVTKSDPDPGDVTHYNMSGWTPTALTNDFFFQGHFYRFVGGAESWDDARQQAAGLDGHLANITSAAENAFIRNSVTQGQFAFIGGSDAAQEGVWKWMDGPEADQTFGPGDTDHPYAAWWGSEPNNLDGIEHYAYIDHNAAWTDGTIDFVSGFVVEFSDLSQFTEFSLGGIYGNAVFNTATGLLTYHLDNNDPDTQALALGQFATDSFNITVNDNHGAGNSKTVNFTIDGANDAPVIQEGLPDPGPITAPAGTPGEPLVFSNNFSFSDVDKTDTHDVTWVFNAEASNLAENFGLFTASEVDDTSNGTGGLAHWEFSVDPEAVNSLATGEYFAVYDVIVSDHEGGSDTHQVTITINGTNSGGGDGNQPPVAEDDSIFDVFSYFAGTGHWYSTLETPLSWFAATDVAWAYGAYLATITSQEENDFVQVLVSNLGGDLPAWIAGTDDPLQGALEEGNWRWIGGPEDQQPFGYTNWDPFDNEPNGETLENYVYMRPTGFWADYLGEGGDLLPSIVEMNAFTEDQQSFIAKSILLANDTDADPGANLDVIDVGTEGLSANDALVSIVDGVIVYDPRNSAQMQALSAGEIADDTFTYTVSDGTDSDTATVTIKVVGINDAPTLEDDEPDVRQISIPAGTPGVGFEVADNFAFHDPDNAELDPRSVSFSFNEGMSTLASGINLSSIGTFTAQMLNDASGNSAGLVHWEFDVDGDQMDDFNNLAPETYLVFDVQVTDVAGLLAVHQVIIDPYAYV